MKSHQKRGIGYKKFKPASDNYNTHISHKSHHKSNHHHKKD